MDELIKFYQGHPGICWTVVLTVIFSTFWALVIEPKDSTGPK